jgi:hypothetical protein
MFDAVIVAPSMVAKSLADALTVKTRGTSAPATDTVTVPSDPDAPAADPEIVDVAGTLIPRPAGVVVVVVVVVVDVVVELVVVVDSVVVVESATVVVVVVAAAVVVVVGAAVVVVVVGAAVVVVVGAAVVVVVSGTVIVVGTVTVGRVVVVTICAIATRVSERNETSTRAPATREGRTCSVSASSARRAPRVDAHSHDRTVGLVRKWHDEMAR